MAMRLKIGATAQTESSSTATAKDMVGGQSKTVSVDYKKGVKPMDKLASI